MSNWHWQTDAGPFAPSPAMEEASSMELLDEDAEGPNLDLVYVLHQRLIAEIDPQKLASLDRAQGYEAVITAARRTLSEVAPNVVGEARDAVLDAVADE